MSLRSRIIPETSWSYRRSKYTLSFSYDLVLTMPVGISYTSGSKLSLNRTFMGLVAALEDCDLEHTQVTSAANHWPSLLRTIDSMFI